MPKPFNIKKFNGILKEYNQQLYAEKITGKEIILSNGLILDSERDIRLCKKRVLFGDKIWKENFDRIYSLNVEEGKVAEKECRSSASIKGGISCQKKYGKKIKSNLNTGVPWNKGLKGNYPYSNKHTDETKLKIGNSNSGVKNGMFGYRMTLEEKKKKSLLMKEKILSGKFTPNSNNRNTHWDSYYKGKKYRSSWEALYQYFDQDAEYEILRIPYLYENKELIYIVDFINRKTKTLIEVKPIEMISHKKMQEKISAVKKWCKNTGYKFIIADKNFLISKKIPTDLSEFDIETQKKIKSLYAIS